jgi:hypothetical protein
MSSVPRVASALQRTLLTVPAALERETGFCQRRSKCSGALFVQTLVFGFLAEPHPSLFTLTTTAAQRGVLLSPQGLDQRFTPAGARLLEGVLTALATEVIAADPVPISLLRRFPAVVLLDSTTITLPDALAPVWAGCGGRVATHTQAALKVTIRWDLVTGHFDGPVLSAGRTQDRATALQHRPIPAGGIRIADVGFFSLQVCQELGAQSASFLSRLPAQTVLYPAGSDERLDLMTWLTEQGARPGTRAECAVDLGTDFRIPARLLAVRVPPEVAAERRATIEYDAHREGERPSVRALERADWTLLVTNVPAAQLTIAEALALLRARWQIELLFKLWKDLAQLDAWTTAKPDRIRCEVLAKLIAVVIAHWIELTGAYTHADHSLHRAFLTIRTHSASLIPVLHRRRALLAALRTLATTLGGTGHLIKRKRRPTSAQLLANPAALALA